MSLWYNTAKKEHATLAKTLSGVNKDPKTAEFYQGIPPLSPSVRPVISLSLPLCGEATWCSRCSSRCALTPHTRLSHGNGHGCLAE